MLLLAASMLLYFFTPLYAKRVLVYHEWGGCRFYSSKVVEVYDNGLVIIGRPNYGRHEILGKNLPLIQRRVYRLSEHEYKSLIGLIDSTPPPENIPMRIQSTGGILNFHTYKGRYTFCIGALEHILKTTESEQVHEFNRMKEILNVYISKYHDSPFYTYQRIRYRDTSQLKRFIETYP
jgi:hypothetical protein